MSLFRPAHRDRGRDRVALIIQLAADAAGIPAAELAERISARLDELLADDD